MPDASLEGRLQIVDNFESASVNFFVRQERHPHQEGEDSIEKYLRDMEGFRVWSAEPAAGWRERLLGEGDAPSTIEFIWLPQVRSMHGSRKSWSW